MMESFRTDDGAVGKYVHSDGSETAIKCVPSQSTFIRPDGTYETKHTDRHKYSIFISVSVGCFLKCPQCWLTLKDSKYVKLTAARVLANVQEALAAEVLANPAIKDRYVKVCWMGMGDALSQPTIVQEVTLQLLEWITTNGYAAGLDSVDLSTVGPSTKANWLDTFVQLNQALTHFTHNPHNLAVEQAQVSNIERYATRSTFRIFYSLHSAVQSTRDVIAPNTALLADITPTLHKVNESGLTLIFHQLFVEGINSTPTEVSSLVDYLAQFPNNEFRVLRYNECSRSPYREWSEIDNAVETLIKSHPMVKVQQSAGSEVAAACGQFLVTQTRVHLTR